MTDQLVTETVNKLASAWEEFKSTNDQRLKEIEKRGAADPLLESKLSKISDALDHYKTRMDSIETALSRGDKFTGEGKKGDDELHRKAFVNFMRKGDKLEPDELKALSVGSDPDGGYTVRPEISSQIITKINETSPVRAVASIQTIGTDQLEILEDKDIAGSSWTNETGTVSETTSPQFGVKTITAHEIYAEPRATQKFLDDSSINVEAWLAGKVAEAFALAENTAFVNGNGVGKPKGFLQYAAGTSWGQIQQVASGSSGSFDADDLISVFYTLKESYATNATWMMNRAIVATVRTLKENSNNQYLWQPGLQAGAPDLLLGRPVVQASDMPVAASNSLSIAVGDFRRGYQIVDRLGIRVQRDPFTAKPYVKFYTTKRVGGDVVNFEAIKLLKLGS